MYISDHISYAEVTNSATAKQYGIDNTPNEQQIKFIKYLAIHLFEPLRAGLGGFPLHIVSFFRCKKLNLHPKVGGSKTSQHMALNGAAMDIDMDGRQRISNKQVFDFILKHLEFDQLIWEFGTNKNPGWVHVSNKPSGNRRKITRAVRINGKIVYKHYKNAEEFYKSIA